MEEQITAMTPLMRRFERQHGVTALAFWMKWGPPGGFSVQNIADTTDIARRTWENWANRFGWPWKKRALND